MQTLEMATTSGFVTSRSGLLMEDLSLNNRRMLKKRSHRTILLTVIISFNIRFLANCG